MVPLPAQRRMGAFHEPWLVWSPAFRRLERLGPAEAGTPSCQRFMVPMRGIKVVQATHEPACSAGFPACGFTGLSSPVDQERATGKSPEPAGSKACATNPPRFMVPMRAKYNVEALPELRRGSGG